MKSFRALALYLAAVVIGAAVAAPWLWWAMQSLAAGSPAWSPLAHQPFHRYVNRCLLVLALGLLWPLVRAFRLRSWADVGWHWEAAERRRWAGFFALGFFTLGAATVLALVGSGRLWAPQGGTGRWMGKIAGAAGTAVVVSVLEEFLFRGAVFSALRRQSGFLLSGGITSAVYAWVHFFERPPQPASIDAASGFRTLGLMFRGFTDLGSLVPGLLSLLLAGWMLALLRERTRGLGASIGLHAGWIFWLKAYGFLTTDAPGADPRIWGTGRLYDGWVALGLLAIVAVILHVRVRPNPDEPEPTAVAPGC